MVLRFRRVGFGAQNLNLKLNPMQQCSVEKGVLKKNLADSGHRAVWLHVEFRGSEVGAFSGSPKARY